jgi:hypothetical protein
VIVLAEVVDEVAREYAPVADQAGAGCASR